MHMWRTHAAYGRQPEHGKKYKIKQGEARRGEARQELRLLLFRIVAALGPLGRQRLSSSWYGITSWPVAADKRLSLVARQPRHYSSCLTHVQPFAAICTRKTKEFFFFLCFCCTCRGHNETIGGFGKMMGRRAHMRFSGMNLSDLHMHGICKSFISFAILSRFFIEYFELELVGILTVMYIFNQNWYEHCKSLILWNNKSLLLD